MTESQIVAKLRTAVSREPTSEAEVVYILVQSRKLLDDVKHDDPHFALKLYFHWALHVDLTGRDTTLPFLRKVDEFVEFALLDTNFAAQHHMFKEFGFFTSFRQLFGEFLSSMSLPTTLCEEDQWWQQFITLYANVVEDGSLSCSSLPGELRRISGVRFTKGRTIPDGKLPFDMVWDVFLIGGGKITVNVHAVDGPGGNEMLIHGIRLCLES